MRRLLRACELRPHLHAEYRAWAREERIVRANTSNISDRYSHALQRALDRHPPRLRDAELAAPIGRLLRRVIESTSEEDRFAEERICNLFARALLMPADAVQIGLTIDRNQDPWHLIGRIEQTAMQLGVQPAPLLLRLTEMELPDAPFVVVLIRYLPDRATGNDHCLRVVRSYSFERHGFAQWAQPNTPIPVVGPQQPAVLWNAWSALLERGERPTGRFTVAEDGILRPVYALHRAAAGRKAAPPAERHTEDVSHDTLARSAHLLYAPTARREDAAILSAFRVTRGASH